MRPRWLVAPLLDLLAQVRQGRREPGRRKASTSTSPVIVRSSLKRAVSFLARRQLPWGEFRADRYSTPDLRGRGRKDSGVFGTAVVLHALSRVDDPRVAALIQRGLSFLLEERGVEGVWCYWSSRNTATITADVDVTSCAGHLIQMLRPAAVHPDSRAAVMENRDARGRFLTWFRKPGLPNDVDAVVNANALLFVGEQDSVAAADALVHVLNTRSETASYCYYLDDLSLYYAISRAWRHGGVTRLGACRDVIMGRTLVRRGPDGSFGDELATALALCTLLSWKGLPWPAVAESADFLLRAQRRDGSWAARAYYAGPVAPTPHEVWWGSPEMTTALCIEAFAELLRGVPSVGC